MSRTDTMISKEVEELQADERKAADIFGEAAAFEHFYQEMLAAGVARKEEYSVITPGDLKGNQAVFLRCGM